MRRYFEEILFEQQEGGKIYTSVLATICDLENDAVITRTFGGTIKSWSRGAELMFGYPADVAIGQPIHLIIPDPYRGEEQDLIETIARGEKTREFRAARRDSKGALRMISLATVPVAQTPGRIVLASTSMHETEAPRETAAQRAEAAQEVAELSREVARHEATEEDLKHALDARDDFIGVAAHELRNPLNVIALTIQLLKQACEGREIPPQIRLLAERLRIQNSRLNALMDRLLDLTRIRANRFELYPSRFDLALLAKEVTLRFEAEHPDISFVRDINSGPEGNWDRVRIDQALTNLLSNAVKYGRGRPITVVVRPEDGAAVLEVRDQGTGLAEEDRARIFDRFERGRGVESKGLGLGLWITAHIVETHGGTIRVESQLEKGSSFIIKLPLESR